MKKVTQVLTSEHELIERATACFLRLSDETHETDELCVITAVELLEFFEHFVDAAHQEKEERCLLPALVACGLAPQRVSALVDDHRREREDLAALRSHLEGAAYGDAWCRDLFVSTATKYATLLREHAAEEELCMLRLVEELLDDDAEGGVLAGFHEIDATLLPKPRKHYFALVHGAAARLGLREAVAACVGA